MRTVRCVSMWILVLSSFSLSAQNRIWVVAPQPGVGVDFTKVKDALNAASLRDTILIKDGHYLENQLTIQKGVTMVAENPNGATIEATTRTRPAIAKAIHVFGRGVPRIA